MKLILKVFLCFFCFTSLGWGGQGKVELTAAADNKTYSEESKEKQANFLLKKVAQKGSLAVIISLHTGKVSLSEAMKKPTKVSEKNFVYLKEVKNRVLSRLKEKNALVLRSAKVFRYSPSIALTVDLDLLNSLLADPDVKGIHENKMNFPSLRQSTAITNANRAWLTGYTGQGQAMGATNT